MRGNELDRTGFEGDKAEAKGELLLDALLPEEFSALFDPFLESDLFADVSAFRLASSSFQAGTVDVSDPAADVGVEDNEDGVDDFGVSPLDAERLACNSNFH